MWGSGVLAGLSTRLLSALAAWVHHELDDQEAARELGISTDTLTSWLREAGTLTHLPLTKDRPGAEHDLLWALYVTGRVRPASLAGAEAGGRQAGAVEAVPPVDGEPRTDRPHPARVYDYFLGGRTNFAADRIVAQQSVEATPQVAMMARENRGFMLRAARHLAGERGVRQFLDIGAGIPTEPNLHQVAQSEDPSARSSTSTTTRSCTRTPSRCWAAARRGASAFLRADANDPEGSSSPRRSATPWTWTSPSRSPSSPCCPS